MTEHRWAFFVDTGGDADEHQVLLILKLEHVEGPW
jgi:hypothetical protein